MILIDINVPALDAVYDFQIAEDATIATLIEEITEMILQREKLSGLSGMEGLILCSVTNEEVLARDRTLKEYGVNTGSRLLLI